MSPERAEDLLRELAHVHANPRGFIGQRYFRCPRCSHLRRKKRDKVLSVKSEPDGFMFNCHHCGWYGGAFYERFSSGTGRFPRHGAAQDRARDGRKVRALYGG